MQGARGPKYLSWAEQELFTSWRCVCVLVSFTGQSAHCPASSSHRPSDYRPSDGRTEPELRAATLWNILGTQRHALGNQHVTVGMTYMPAVQRGEIILKCVSIHTRIVHMQAWHWFELEVCLCLSSEGIKEWTSDLVSDLLQNNLLM